MCLRRDRPGIGASRGGLGVGYSNPACRTLPGRRRVSRPFPRRADGPRRRTSTATSPRSWRALPRLPLRARSRRASSTCRARRPRPSAAGRTLEARRGRRDAAEEAAVRRGEGSPEGVDRRRRGLGHRPDRPVPLHDRDPGRATTGGRSSRSSARPPGTRTDAQPDRPFVLAKLERQGAVALAARGRPPHADPPRHVRPDRPAADAGGGRRRSSPTTSPDAYEKRGRPAARVAALRRALGAALARRRPLRRERRLRARTSRGRTPGATATGSIRALNADMPYDRVRPAAARRRRAAARRPGRA